MILQFSPVVDLLIYTTWMVNYKVMWVFTKRRFDVVLHKFNPHTGRIFTCTLQFPRECQRSYPLTCLTMLSLRIITFFVYSGVLSFHAVALSRVLPSIIDDCFCLVWPWIDTGELSQLWFSLLILMVELPFMFVLTILLPFALLPVVILSVWKSSLVFSVDSVISLIDSNESSTFGQNKSIFCLFFFFN